MTEPGVLPDVVERFLAEPVAAPSLPGLRAAGCDAVRRRRRRAAGAVAAVVVAGAVTGGVVAAGPADRPRERNAAGDPLLPPADLSVFHRSSGDNLLVYDGPEALADDRAFVAAGEIAGFADGYELLERGSPSEGYDIRDRTVVVRVRVTQVYKGSVETLDDTGSVYLSLSRGAAQEGVPDDGGPSTITPVSAFEEAVPLGTEVIVFGSARRPFSSDTMVVDRHRGVPEGGTVFVAGHPQSLVFGLPGGGTTGWRGLSLDEVRDRLGDRFADATASMGPLQCLSNRVSFGSFDHLLPVPPERARRLGYPRTAREAAMGSIAAPFAARFGALALSDAASTEDGDVRFAGINADGRRVVLLTVDEVAPGAWSLVRVESCG